MNDKNDYRDIDRPVNWPGKTITIQYCNISSNMKLNLVPQQNFLKIRFVFSFAGRELDCANDRS